MAVLAEAGLTYTEAAFRARYLGLGGSAWKAALDADHLARFGAAMPAGLYDRVSAAVTAAVLADVRPVPGSADLARRIRAPLACASSSPRVELNGKLRALGLAELFGGRVFSSDDVAAAKPAPDLYLAAAASLGLPPERCRAIEDSPNGVRAAHGAGLPVVGFAGSAPDPADHAVRLTEAGAAAIAFDFDQVAAWLAAQGVALDRGAGSAPGRRPISNRPPRP